ncbi:hypothetical protein J437_LFUL004137 [Ladona fulva]|uniref:TIL domain-containing protein n=1 Tax=Ladona fulva TaxID=123851 RepID=A0A8K0K185_LADFU|nr:hypothetical protein J437_LFUL004137 [Ladona fulva]
MKGEGLMRRPRGVRGGEGDNTVEVVAAQGWHRHKAPPRELACRRDEVFQECGSACPRTCLSIRSPRACPNTCSVGCFCREGMVRDYSGRCIQENECP